MFFSEPVYDLKELLFHNLHLHTHYSGCGKPEMVIPAIVEKAREAGLKTIALTDHYNDRGFDKAYLRQITILRNYAEYCDLGDLKILYGSELSAYGAGKWLESDETNAALDYRLYSANHYHLDFWEHPEDKSARGYALHNMGIIRAVSEVGRADCIAHPLIGRFIDCLSDRDEATRAITDNELGELTEVLKKNNTAWEINAGAILGDPAFGRRLWNIGREIGATFHFGTDGHRLADISPWRILPQLVSILN